MQIKKNILLILALQLITFVSYAQLIPLTLIGKDNRNGMQLTPNFEVKSLKTSIELPISMKDNNAIVKVSKNDRIIIKAKLDGYYSNEKIYEIDESFDEEGRNIVINLDPQPALNFTVAVNDAINGKPIDAKVELIKGLTASYSTITDKKTNPVKIVVTEPANYLLRVSADGYAVFEKQLKLEVGDPVASLKEAVVLTKKENVIIVQVINTQLEPIKEATVKITDAKNKVLKSGILTNGQEVIQYGDAKEIFIDINATGYFFHTEKIAIVNNENYVIKLKNKPLYQVSVFDITSGKRISADVTLTPKNGRTTTLKSSSEASVEYYPNEEGIISINAKARGFQDYESNFVIRSTQTAQPIDIKMLSVLEDYVIFILDENKKPVEKASVRVNDQNGAELPIDFKASTGEWTVKLEKGKNYELIATAPTFEVKKLEVNTLKGKLIGVSLEKKKANFMVTLLDEYLKTPVVGRVKYSSSNTTFEEKESNQNGEVRIESKTNKGINVQVSAENYVGKSEILSFENELSKEILLTKYNYEIDFTVKNAETNQPVTFESLTILQKENATIRTFQNAQNAKSSIEPNKMYGFDIKAKGFEDFKVEINSNELLKFGNLKKEFLLTPKSTVEHIIEVVDDVTKKAVPNVQLKIFTKESQYSTLPFESKWKVIVKNGVPYTIEVSSPDYGVRSIVNDDFDKTTYIVALTKFKETETQFEAFDEVLSVPIPAKFILLADDKIQDLNQTLGGTRSKAKLQENKNYMIRVSAVDYRDIEQKVAIPAKANETIRINFKKEFYPVKFFVLDESGKKLSKEPTFNVVEKSGTKVKIAYIFDKGIFELQVKPSSDYKIDLQAEGFESQEIQFTLDELVKSKSERTIKLKKLESEKVIKEIVPEPKKVEEKPLPVKVEVLSEKKDEPKPVIKPEAPKPLPTNVFDINALNVVNIPESVSEISAAFTGDVAKTKKFILTNVFFDQSSPVMQEASYKQLKQLVEVLKQNPALVIHLVGHTDDRGDKRQNQYLSEFRAKVVSNYLFNNGIDFKRIITKGLGQDFPIAPNDSEENRAKNRRVELIVLEN